ncbi:MAG: SAM-dependent methyltransferase [Nocardioidaceae bacterium]|nr:SAM-dependent methyltransferase [Nocardioidaceae bacterium]
MTEPPLPRGLRESRAEVVRRLAAAGVASPGADAEQLLAHVLGVSRGSLLTSTLGHQVTLEHQVLSDEQATGLEQLVSRRERREPLQYLLGVAGFRTVQLRVGAGVFVPRPETELLAGWAVEQLSGRPDQVAVDLCTGSGAIAAALAAEAPSAQVYAVELSPRAYEYAVTNLAGTGVDVRLGDIADALTELNGDVDLVVANPPYIPLEAYEEVELEARVHDPAVALWSGTDGLDTIRSVARVAARLLGDGGVVGCEHAEAQGRSAPDVFRAGGWHDVVDHLDLSGRPRFVTARR